MTNQPIFIVGVQRSGTTLLAAMLGAHSRLSCGPETHFFRWLRMADPGRLCDRDAWPQPAVEFLASISQAGVRAGTRATLIGKYQISEQTIAEYLRTREPSIANVLSSVTEHYMAANQKVRWVEKTPDHLLHLEAIRAHFPKSPILRIVRDPRDVALSLMKVPWGVKSFFEGVSYWERLNRMSRGFFADDGLSCTIRFEDLVSSPVETLRTVCRFIGEEFQEQMLDTSRTGAAVNSQDAPWKRKARETVDVGRVAVWRSELTRPQNQLAEAVLGDQIESFGYPRQESFNRLGELRPRGEAAAKYAGALAAVANHGVRFWKATPDERSGATVYLGEPGTKEWLGETRTERVTTALPVLVDIARAAVSDRDVYWAPGPARGQWTGWLAFTVRRMLARYELRVEPVDPADNRHMSAGDWPAVAVERKNVG